MLGKNFLDFLVLNRFGKNIKKMFLIESFRKLSKGILFFITLTF